MMGNKDIIGVAKVEYRNDSGEWVRLGVYQDFKISFSLWERIKYKIASFFKKGI